MTENNNNVIAEAVRTATSLLDGIVRSLVDEPTAVEVHAITNEELTRTFLDLKVAPADVGKVIRQTGAYSTRYSYSACRCKHEAEAPI